MEKEYLTTKEVAELMSLSQQYIRILCFKKEIPYYKSKGGKMNYFKKSEIVEWMTATRVEPDLTNNY